MWSKRTTVVEWWNASMSDTCFKVPLFFVAYFVWEDFTTTGPRPTRFSTYLSTLFPLDRAINATDWAWVGYNIACRIGCKNQNTQKGHTTNSQKSRRLGDFHQGHNGKQEPTEKSLNLALYKGPSIHPSKRITRKSSISSSLVWVSRLERERKREKLSLPFRVPDLLRSKLD